MKMNKTLPDIIISILLLGWLATLGMQVPEIPLVSRNYPLALIVVSAAMTLFMLIKSVVKYKTAEIVETHAMDQVKIIVPFCIMIIAYLMLMTIIGYIFATVLFVIVALCYLRMKNKVAVIILALAMTVILYYVFSNYLIVILPKGSLINFSL